MVKNLWDLFLFYLPFGLLCSLKVILRILILPFWKIDDTLPKKGKIIDIGCGDGGLTNYLSLRAKERTLVGIDFTKKRINLAKNSIKGLRGIAFIQGNVITTNLDKADAYLLVDVLHHIEFSVQKKLLNVVVKKMDDNSVLVIKEVDDSNFFPFWFGHLIEKILYPGQIICTRSKKDWLGLFTSLGLSYKVESGSLFFPDSTLIFVCKKN